MNMKISFSRPGLHRSIADMAYVVGDVASEPGNAHLLHQTFDICEGENLRRIDTLITHAFLEAATVLSPLLQGMHESLTLIFKEKSVKTLTVLRIKETVRELMIARAIHGWLSVTLPSSAGIWETRARQSLDTLRCLTHVSRPLHRPLPPF